MGKADTIGQHRISRRGAVAVGGIGLAAALQVGTAAASAQENAGRTVAFWLQQFTGGTIDITGNGRATLGLNGGTGYTSVVTNATPPQAGRVPTPALIDTTLAESNEQFLATLAIATPDGDQDVLVRVLAARYDEGTNTVEYDIAFVPPEAAQSVDVNTFGATDVAIAVEDIALLPDEEAAAMCAPATVATTGQLGQGNATAGNPGHDAADVPPSGSTGPQGEQEPPGSSGEPGDEDDEHGEDNAPGNPDQEDAPNGQHPGNGQDQGGNQQDQDETRQTIDASGTIEQNAGGASQSIQGISAGHDDDTGNDDEED